MRAPHTFEHEAICLQTFRDRAVLFRQREMRAQDASGTRSSHFKYLLLTRLCTKRFLC